MFMAQLFCEYGMIVYTSKCSMVFKVDIPRCAVEMYVGDRKAINI